MCVCEREREGGREREACEQPDDEACHEASLACPEACHEASLACPEASSDTYHEASSDTYHEASRAGSESARDKCHEEARDMCLQSAGDMSHASSCASGQQPRQDHRLRGVCF